MCFTVFSTLCCTAGGVLQCLLLYAVPLTVFYSVYYSMLHHIRCFTVCITWWCTTDGVLQCLLPDVVPHTVFYSVYYLMLYHWRCFTVFTTWCCTTYGVLQCVLLDVVPLTVFYRWYSLHLSCCSWRATRPVNGITSRCMTAWIPALTWWGRTVVMTRTWTPSRQQDTWLTSGFTQMTHRLIRASIYNSNSLVSGLQNIWKYFLYM